jgi:drug/metabolite transporter (DMT)-like permease
MAGGNEPSRRAPAAAIRRSPLAWCVLSAALFGASTPATKHFADRLGPFAIAGLLYVGAAVAVCPWALRSRWRGTAMTAPQRLYLAGALVFGGVVGPVLLVAALAIAPAGSVALWLNLETVATALLARWLFREHLHLPTWLAVVLIALGSVLLSTGHDRAPQAAGLVALACVAWGLDNNFTSLVGSYTPAQVTFAKGVVGGAINLGLASAFGGSLPLAPTPAAQLLAVGALGYGASLVLYVASAQQLGATRSQLIFSTAPAFGLGLSWLALGEPVLPEQVGAGLIMLVAIWLWQKERHAHSHTHEPLVHAHWHRHDDGHHDHHPGGETGTWHSHEHSHAPETHSHPHLPDLHHRHRH